MVFADDNFVLSIGVNLVLHRFIGNVANGILNAHTNSKFHRSLLQCETNLLKKYPVKYYSAFIFLMQPLLLFLTFLCRHR